MKNTTTSHRDPVQPTTAKGMGLEVNLDGLVGPTHNYSGLSSGNLASEKHRQVVSHPKQAALQGLDKMKRLAELGLLQGVLPPQERPDVYTLRAMGFSGSDEAVLEKAFRQAPDLLHAVGSSSSMWTANAATVSPSSDSADGRAHFVPANLNSKFHRSLEPATTTRVLRRIFSNPTYFEVHDPLPPTPHLGDEGAANHTRFCKRGGGPGIHLFVYGRSAFQKGPEPKRFPARQTVEASQSVGRLLQIEARSLFVQQNPDAIDAGVFHNDVISVGNECVFFFHERAFINTAAVIQALTEKFSSLCQAPLVALPVLDSEVSVEDAVKSYLFNSQLVSLPSGRMALIAPSECEQHPRVAPYLRQLIGRQNNPIHEVVFMDVRQSMQNGGGPACLRLRTVLTDEERSEMSCRVMWSPDLDRELRAWVGKHYRDALSPQDLADPLLLKESRAALDELTRILKLGSVYRFQQS